jgi:hypothetical protein
MKGCYCQQESVAGQLVVFPVQQQSVAVGLAHSHVSGVAGGRVLPVHGRQVAAEQIDFASLQGVLVTLLYVHEQPVRSQVAARLSLHD